MILSEGYPKNRRMSIVGKSTPRSRRVAVRNRNGGLFSWLTILLAVAVLAYVLVQGFSEGHIRHSGIVVFTFLLNACYSLVLLKKQCDEMPFTLKQVHWVFFYTYFCVTPLSQYLLGQWPWGVMAADAQVLSVNLVLFVWGVLFTVLSGSNSPFRDEEVQAYNFEINLSQSAATVLCACSVGATLLLAALVGPSHLFLRTESSVDMGNTSTTMLVNVLLRGWVFGSFAGILVNYTRHKNHRLTLALSGLCVLISCFPTAMARFNVAAVYLGIFIIGFRSFTTKKGLFAFFLLVGFLLAYPFFNAFKYLESGTQSSLISLVESSFASGFLSGNYDAYSTFFWVTNYCSDVSITYGRQLLGALLFFIPRAIWPTKPVPSGQMIFEYYGRAFTDIACSLPAEGYLNFGIFGVFLFAIVFALLVRKIDGGYWMARIRADYMPLKTINLYYPFLLSLVFYLLRGALMTTMTFVIGYLVAFACVVAAIRLFERYQGLPGR
ncbi:hypothetical protein SAMN05216348_11516 [Olsenella sp. KH3B4]|uniref:O-antigen polymerase n=1 Tax=Olsenella sp. KH3B4 TaxID=1855394 RepID=UPI0008C7A911|nr:O-antigen polymerase [Olsenella sp. KH3B4]SET31301.1 hypothetical protein SAMN05216348_11516 [Olsenella sp. KH3B4]